MNVWCVYVLVALFKNTERAVSIWMDIKNVINKFDYS